MTYLVERLAELRRHMVHLRELRPRAGGVGDLESDFSLHNDGQFSLLTVSKLVIDIAGENAGARDRPQTVPSAVDLLPSHRGREERESSAEGEARHVVAHQHAETPH